MLKVEECMAEYVVGESGTSQLWSLGIEMKFGELLKIIIKSRAK